MDQPAQERFTPEQVAALVEQLLRDARAPVRGALMVGDRPRLYIGAQGLFKDPQVTISFRALEDDLSRLRGWINGARFELHYAFSALTDLALRGRLLNDLQHAAARAILGLQNDLQDVTGITDEPEFDPVETIANKTDRAERVARGARVLRGAVDGGASIISWDAATQTISGNDDHGCHVTITPALDDVADVLGEHWTSVTLTPTDETSAPRR